MCGGTTCSGYVAAWIVWSAQQSCWRCHQVNRCWWRRSRDYHHPIDVCRRARFGILVMVSSLYMQYLPHVAWSRIRTYTSLPLASTLVSKCQWASCDGHALHMTCGHARHLSGNLFLAAAGLMSLHLQHCLNQGWISLISHIYVFESVSLC